MVLGLVRKRLHMGWSDRLSGIPVNTLGRFRGVDEQGSKGRKMSAVFESGWKSLEQEWRTYGMRTTTGCLYHRKLERFAIAGTERYCMAVSCA